ncbi:hypothetical protein B0H16DRAFT_1732806 [Mycena metata]|uniref:Uncharacterized protein n=1 Tax=Mycena metata TaxID=1033252 RepID=A0AAD7MTV9_9AGAR|nr:hypothetical protein B0H16DRAFT_1732806 [Mycena metata]
MFDGLSSPDLQTSMVGGPLLMLAPFGLGISVLGFGPLCTFWLLSCFRCAQCAFNGTMGVARTVMSKTRQTLWTYCIRILYAAAHVEPGRYYKPFHRHRRCTSKLGNEAAQNPGQDCTPMFPSIPLTVCSAACIFRPSVYRHARAKNSDVAATESSPLLHDENSAAADLKVIPQLHELLTLCDMAYDALFPLIYIMPFLSIPRPKRLLQVYSTPIPLGGLGLEPFDIGRIMGLCGIINAIFRAFFGG